MSTVIKSVTRRIGTSEVFAEHGYVVFVSPGMPRKYISPATFEERAIALYKEAERMKQNDDRWKDERKKRVDLAAAMMEVAKEARQQVLIVAPLAAIVNPELKQEFQKGYAPRLYTGVDLNGG